MQEYALPEEIRGEWVWDRVAADKLESYVFFRKEFMLSETPALAEFWVTARTLFHLYINGRYLGFGPPPSPAENTYVVYFDVGFLIETGKNTIAVAAHNANVSRYASRRQPSGLWGQLNIDGSPLVWTDKSWLCWPADCYAGQRPRASVSAGFTEKLDLRYYPNGWEEKDFNSVRWKRPDHLVSLGKARGRLKPVSSPNWNVVKRPSEAVVVRGVWRQAQASTYVSFEELAGERGPGVYVAEAFFYSQNEGTAEFELFSDDPYCFFLNGQCVKQQGVSPLPTKADLDASRPPCFRQCEMATTDGELDLVRGWNHFVITQQVEPGSAGFALVFAELEPAVLRLFRKQNQENMIGWSIAGPIRTPLPLVTGNLGLGELPKTVFVPSTREVVDESAFLSSCSFDARDETPSSEELVEIGQGEYAIWDIGATVYGCPDMLIEGDDGDVVDIVHGEQLIQGQLLPYCDGQRNVDTIVLGPKSCHYMSCAPRGLRYLMVVGRRVSRAVRIRECGVTIRDYSFDNPGSFDSSDPTFNQIWEVGTQTLKATMQGLFLDSPAKERAQYVADAMLQSWAGYHTFGSFSLAAKGIQEFASVQFETGEMPALCPSDVYVNMPDYSLLWPVWLHRHYLYTGDRQFLDHMMPSLHRLLAYYEQVADSGTCLLGDLDERFGAYCFLDHGPIDRQGIVTGLNAIYCRSMLSAVWLNEETGATDIAKGLRRRVARVAANIRELTWDPDRGLFADCWYDGEMSEFYSWQTNVLGIYGGIVPAGQYDEVFDRLFSKDQPFELFAAGETNNPYFKYFVLESAFALARRAWALGMIHRYWGGMVRRGARTWWELFDPDGNEDEIHTFSLCHGYGTTPNGYLLTELAGIRPAKPGFTTVYFNPLPGSVRWVKAQVPTPYGRIVVEWELRGKQELEAVIDANYPLEVIPVLAPAYSESATIHVSPDVVILAEPA